MHFVYADDSQNLLHLIYVGTLDPAAAEHMLDAVKQASVRLRPGFSILADLRDLKRMDKLAVPRIDAMMEFLNARGAGRVVRVLPGDTANFGFSIMSIFHYDHDVRFVTCLNLEKAWSVLFAPGGRPGPAEVGK